MARGFPERVLLYGDPKGEHRARGKKRRASARKDSSPQACRVDGAVGQKVERSRAVHWSGRRKPPKSRLPTCRRWRRNLRRGAMNAAKLLAALEAVGL